MAVFRRAERKEKGNEGEMISFRARCSKYSTFCLTLCAPCSILFGLETPQKKVSPWRFGRCFLRGHENVHFFPLFKLSSPLFSKTIVVIKDIFAIFVNKSQRFLHNIIIKQPLGGVGQFLSVRCKLLIVVTEPDLTYKPSYPGSWNHQWYLYRVTILKTVLFCESYYQN